MVTKKNVLVMVLVLLMVAATVSAGVMGRGSFGAGAVVASTTDGDDVTRPIQRWQTLDAETLADCPLYDGEDFDTEAFLLLQEERAAFRDEMQSNRNIAARQSYGTMGMQGRYAVQSAPVMSNRGPARGNQGAGRSPMNQNYGGASFGPVWSR
ncbi:MAG TPA: hypothetical protein DHV69_05850 [Sphaerochaeta sp.]|nr:MAG: hypothetical protein A2Y31_09130 [Spirochaetes bacterium GWC2_52_13]OHD62647.1 MAG: hypothetical protein A2101_03000 [Spirochaetes bacterium GWF2_52_7]HCG63593.1 hypothetical protein [Sphaerochaeta sp.]HCJ94723.1 hypothetical protein [Sphaerochaeta sp.]HCS36842.1 hypothetical protein [Sphaerochaeta sp.]